MFAHSSLPRGWLWTQATRKLRPDIWDCDTEEQLQGPALPTGPGRGRTEKDTASQRVKPSASQLQSHNSPGCTLAEATGVMSAPLLSQLPQCQQGPWVLHRISSVQGTLPWPSTFSAYQGYAALRELRASFPACKSLGRLGEGSKGDSAAQPE